MIHILLTILKIIGILLLWMIGIVIAVMLAVLLIPICYEIQGEKIGERIRAGVQISWFFKGLYVKYQWEEKQGKFGVYAFGIELLDTIKKGKERKAQKLAKQKGEKKQTLLKKEKINQEEQQLETKEKDVVSGKENLDFQKINVSFDKQKTKSKKQWRFGDKIKSLWNTICGIPAKFTTFLEKIRLTIQQRCAKMSWWKSFIQKDSTKYALTFVLGEGKTMLKHVLPRKLSGNVVYGLEDPALTGQILAIISIFYPYYDRDLEIIPFFDRNILEGRLKIKGHIVLGFLLIHGVKMICNKEIIRTYKILRCKEA